MSDKSDDSMEITELVNESSVEPTLKDIWRVLTTNSTGLQLELKEHKQETAEKFESVKSQFDEQKRLIGDLNRKITAIQTSTDDNNYEAELTKQRNIRNNVTVMGIPSTKNENPKLIVVKVFSAIDVTVSPSDVHSAYRKGNIIVVRLSDYDTKAAIIKNRTVNKILLSCICPELKSKPNEQIFVNNHTTPYFGRILQCGRNAVRDKRIISMRLTNRGCLMKIATDDEEILVKSVAHFIEIMDAITVSANVHNSGTPTGTSKQLPPVLSTGKVIASTSKGITNGDVNKKKRTGGNKRRNRSFETETSGVANPKSKQKTNNSDDV